MNARMELVKWVAFVLMLGDHVNKAWFNGELPLLTELARVVFPMFAIVLAYRLSQPVAREFGAAGRTLKRLCIWGAIAQPFHMWAFNEGLPLNVLFTFAVAVGAIALIERGWGYVATVLLLTLGLLVDYPIAGSLFVVSMWGVFTYNGEVHDARARPIAQGYIVLGAMLSIGLLCLINGNWYAFAAAPLMLVLHRIPVRVPRLGNVFYWAYPAHLALLAVVASGVGVHPNGDALPGNATEQRSTGESHSAPGEVVTTPPG